MGKFYPCCLLTFVFIVVVQMDTVPGLETADGEMFVKSNSVTTLEDSEEMAPLRSRRSTVVPATLSAAEISGIVDEHNRLRRLQNASDMEEMVSVAKWLLHVAKGFLPLCVTLGFLPVGLYV